MSRGWDVRPSEDRAECRRDHLYRDLAGRRYRADAGAATAEA